VYKIEPQGFTRYIHFKYYITNFLFVNRILPFFSLWKDIITIDARKFFLQNLPPCGKILPLQ